MAPEDFFHPAVVVDARSQSRRSADYALTVTDLKRFEERHGRIPDNAMVIMWTGWQERWDDLNPTSNQDSDGVLHFPGISVQATRWLIDKRALVGLGIDTHGVDPGIDELYMTNTLLLKKHRIDPLIALPRPRALDQRGVSLRDVAGLGQHQREGVLGRRQNV